MTTSTSMPVAGPELDRLTSSWHHWPEWHDQAVVRRHKRWWIAVSPTRDAWAIFVGPMSVPGMFTDTWHFANYGTAMYAATRWTGGEPEGWTYHPRTGRYRPPEGTR